MRGQRLEPEGAEAAGEPLALLHLVRDVRRVGEGGEGERGRERRDGRRRLPPVQLGGGLGVRERVPDAGPGEPEGLGEGAQDDDAVLQEARRRLACVLEVGLVHDERPCGRQLPERAGRVVRPTAERQHRILGPDLRAHEVGGSREEWIGRLVRDRDPVARAGERSRAEQDEVVGAGAQDDVLRRHPRVAGDGGRQVRVPAVRVVLHVGDRRRERAWAGGGKRPGGDVAVEADDLDRVEPGAGRELARRGSPGVGGELGRERPHRRTASAWAGMPSTAASASTTGRTRASPSGVSRWIVTGFRKASSPSPPAARARPPVGRTWFPPVA